MFRGYQARPPLIAVTAAAAVALLIISGLVGLVLAPPDPAPPPPDQRALDALPVVPPAPLAGYTPDAFGHGWTPRPDVGDGCTTREAVLLLAAPDATQDEHCAPHGTWTTSAGTTSNPTDVDVDHVVSLPNAWVSGANRWSPQHRAEFANDLTGPGHPELAPEPRELVAAHQATAGPWTPPALSARCAYARTVIAVKTKYRLAVSGGEKQQLTSMLHHYC